MRPSSEEFRECFEYDPETGLLTRLVRIGSRGDAGKVVGTMNADGYLLMSYRGVVYRVHRVIWYMQTGEWPREIHHANHVRDDNRWENLREVPRGDNARNLHKRRKRTEEEHEHHASI